MRLNAITDDQPNYLMDSPFDTFSRMYNWYSVEFAIYLVKKVIKKGARGLSSVRGAWGMKRKDFEIELDVNKTDSKKLNREYWGIVLDRLILAKKYQDEKYNKVSVVKEVEYCNCCKQII